MCVSEKLVGKLKLKQRVCIRKAHFVLIPLTFGQKCLYPKSKYVYPKSTLCVSEKLCIQLWNQLFGYALSCALSKCKQPQSVPNSKGSTLIAFAFTCKHPFACIQYLYCHCVLLGTTSDACPHLTFQSKDPEALNSKTLLKAQITEAFLWKTDAGINAP